MKLLRHSGLIWVVPFLLWFATAGSAAQTGEVSVNPQLPTIPQRKFLLTDYGAVGDGKTLNTDAFRKGIAACHQAGGGELVVPAGTFVTGPLALTDNMALVLESGAIIRGSEDFKDYENADESGGKDNRFSKARTPVLPLIRGLNLTNVAIRGAGTIDGAGAVWWQRFRAERAAGAPQEGQPAKAGQPIAHPRPRLVWLIGCNRVHIKGVTLKDSPQFHLVPNRCRDVTIEDVKVISPADSPNTDAIDPTSSSKVLIRRCFIDVGDDNVSFKSNPSEGPLENVLVTDCTFKHGHGASVGSNIGGGIRNITVEHCTFEGTDNAIRIKSRRDRGGVVERRPGHPPCWPGIGTHESGRRWHGRDDRGADAAHRHVHGCAPRDRSGARQDGHRGPRHRGAARDAAYGHAEPAADPDRVRQLRRSGVPVPGMALFDLRLHPRSRDDEGLVSADGRRGLHHALVQDAVPRAAAIAHRHRSAGHLIRATVASSRSDR